MPQSSIHKEQHYNRCHFYTDLLGGLIKYKSTTALAINLPWDSSCCRSQSITYRGSRQVKISRRYGSATVDPFGRPAPFLFPPRGMEILFS
jgi:hypothetical protein